MSITYQKLALDLRTALLEDEALTADFLFDIDLFIRPSTNRNLNKKFNAIISVPGGSFITRDNKPFSGETDFDDTTDMDTEHWNYEFLLTSSVDGHLSAEEFERADRKTIFNFLDKVLDVVAKSWKFDDSVLGYAIGDIQNRDDLGQTGFAFSFQVTYDVAVAMEGR